MTNFDEDLLVAQRVDPNYNEEILHQVLRIATYDEYHAYNAYKKIIDTFGSMNPFANIMESEVRHYNMLIPLHQKYDVPLPYDNWYDKIKLPDTILECCEVGVVAEIDNIKMYDDLLMHVDGYPDIQDVLYRLQAASYNNHLPAFRRCVAQYSNEDVNSYNNFENSKQNEQDMMAKVNEFSQIAQKFQSGKMSQEDMMKLLGNTNMSFLGGIALGAVGAAMLPKMFENKED